MARGLARYLGVDPVVVRIAFVVLAFVPFPGFGVLIYIAMLLLVPEEDADGAVGPSRLTERTPGFWVGLGLVGLATFALLGVLSDGRLRGLLPLLLVGLGVALWVDADRRPSAPSAAGAAAGSPTAAAVWGAPAASAPAGGPTSPSTGSEADGSAAGAAPSADGTASGEWHDPTEPSSAPTSAAATWQAPTEPPSWGGGGSGGTPSGPPTAAGPAWTPPPVHRPRSPLGRITLGLALLAGGAAWMVDLLGVATVRLSAMLAIALLVLGLGLLVGSVVGRARWLAAIAAVVLPLTLVATVLDDLGIDLGAGIHQREIVVLDAAQLAEPVVIGAGELIIDLTGLPDTDDLVVDVSMGAGEMHLIVPEGVGLTGRVRMEAGELRLLDEISGGVGIERTIDVPADPGRPTLTLDLRAGVGEVRISSEPAAVPPDETETSEGSQDAGDAEDAATSTTDEITEVQP